jgi:excisionase family DNA binding protein
MTGQQIAFTLKIANRCGKPEQMLTEKDSTIERRSNGDRRRNGNSVNMVKRVLDTSEACRYLRISRPTFLKCIAAGKIRASKIGRGWKVLETELERYLMALQ